jgi:hypothetical protein
MTWLLLTRKPDVDESIDRKMMRGAYLAEASANESLDAQDIYSQLSYSGALGNNEDMYAAGASKVRCLSATTAVVYCIAGWW